MNDIVIENQPILSKLLNKINNSLTMSQAYMLVGNNKEELIKNSITFAKVLICPEKYDQKCSKCNICSRISSNTFGEMKIINPINGVIKKDEILTLRDSFQIKSIEGRNLVYIINNAETLNSSAANSLLKFLEEPQSNVVAIFTTTNLNKVYNTISSRCQIIKLKDCNKLQINFVKTVSGLDEEKINITLDFLFLIENNSQKALALFKSIFLNHFDSKELIKSSLTVMLLAYKDALNYKLFKKMDYFKNETGIKNISNSYSTKELAKKVKFILENISKLEYNVNVLLFLCNFIVGIGEIADGKDNRS